MIVTNDRYYHVKKIKSNQSKCRGLTTSILLLFILMSLFYPLMTFLGSCLKCQNLNKRPLKFSCRNYQLQCLLSRPFLPGTKAGKNI